jgi:hypothetical protein
MLAVREREVGSSLVVQNLASRILTFRNHYLSSWREIFAFRSDHVSKNILGFKFRIKEI